MGKNFGGFKIKCYFCKKNHNKQYPTMLELEKQYQFYLDHEADFLRMYEGKFLVITDDLEVSAFESKKDAYAFGAENVGLGNFLIQECTYNAAHMVNYVNFNLAS